MDFTVLVFLPMILYLGIRTSYEDIKQGKIRNKYIKAGIFYALAANAAIVGYYLLSGIPVRPEYFIDLSVNLLLAFAFGFAAWHMKLWSAADAKLFLAYAFLVPLSTFSNTYILFFPSFVILINTFVPAMLYSAARILAAPGLRKRTSFLWGTDFKEIPVIMINVFWLAWVSGLATLFGIELGLLGSVFIIWSLMYLIYRYAGVHRVTLGVGMSIVRLAFDMGHILTVSFAFEILYYMAMVTGMHMLMMFLVRFSSELKPVPITALRPGMILAEVIHREGGKYKKIPMERVFSMPKGRLVLGETGDGLSEDGIRKITNLYEKKKLNFSEVRIKQTVPFAPFLFLGVLLTVGAQGFFLSVVF